MNSKQVKNRLQKIVDKAKDWDKKVVDGTITDNVFKYYCSKFIVRDIEKVIKSL